MTNEEKVKMIQEDFKMSDDGKMPVVVNNLLNWSSYIDTQTNMLMFWVMGSRIKNSTGIKFTATRIAYIIKYKQWPKCRVNRVDNSVIDYSDNNMLWPENRKERKKHTNIENNKKRLSTLYGYIKNGIIHAKSQCRSGANTKTRSVNFFLTDKKIEELRNKICCAITDTKFDLYKWYLRPSLDRINNEDDYTDDNVQLVCQAYQFLKNSGTDEHAKDAIRIMYESMYGVDKWQKGSGEGE